MTPRPSRILERAETRLTLKQLRLLVAVERHGSILHAARSLNLSQPAATKLIQDLETDFGLAFFNRTNRGVVPTDFGNSLIHHAKLVLAQISHAAQELEDLAEGKAGRVVVGTLLAASARALPLAIAAMLEERPDLVVKVVEGTNEILMPALARGELDLVVGRLSSQRHRRGIEQITLYEEKIVAVVRPGHPLAGRANPDLGEHGWILPPVGTTLRRQIDSYFASRPEAAPLRVVESVSFLTNRSLMGASDLIALLPGHVAEGEIAAGNCVALDWTVPVGAGPVGVATRQGARLSPAANAMIDTMIRMAPDI